ncbi:MAG: hypothetical protein GX868_08895 [Actinobacteria bacterium]|nr:hypothetical protein [Actinomycetota bacterium]
MQHSQLADGNADTGGPVAGAAPHGEAEFDSEPELDFDEFYRAEYAQLARLAYTLCGVRSEAEEFAQEALTRTFANWSTVATLERPDAWSRRVLINDVIGRSRRNATDRRRRGLFVAKEFSPDDPLLSSTSEALWAEVRRLPRRQAQAVALVYGLDLAATEAAEVLGVEAATVRTHLHKARATLAAKLGPEWGGGKR